jgi:FG-GAP-like repeat
VGDFNGDTKLDLAVANGGSTVSVLLGNGNGTFQTHVDYGTGNGPNSVAVGDFNGDGNLDLVTANSGVAGNGKTVSVLLGNGDGTFQAHVDYGTGNGPQSVAVGDFNGDHAQDLAVANLGSTVSVLLNTGGTRLSLTSSANPSTLGESVTFTTSVFPSFVGVGIPRGSVVFKDGSQTLGAVGCPVVPFPQELDDALFDQL